MHQKVKKYRVEKILCVRSIVEVNVLVEAISVKVRFPGLMGLSTKIFALLQKKTIKIFTNFYSHFLQELF